MGDITMIHRKCTINSNGNATVTNVVTSRDTCEPTWWPHGTQVNQHGNLTGGTHVSQRGDLTGHMWTNMVTSREGHMWTNMVTSQKGHMWANVVTSRDTCEPTWWPHGTQVNQHGDLTGHMWTNVVTSWDTGEPTWWPHGTQSQKHCKQHATQSVSFHQTFYTLNSS